jgi:hypothetical protein
VSKTEIKFNKNKTADQVVDVHCAECGGARKHDVVVSLDKQGTEYSEREGWSVDWADHYQVIRCRGCEIVSFRHLSWFSEDVQPGEDDGTTERLYPKRDASSLEKKSLLNVPSSLRRIYSEVIDCYNNDNPTLCAAGLRALVEGTCAVQGIADGPVEVPAEGGGTKMVRKSNLEGKIAGLAEKDILTQGAAQSLHEHRYLGNEAVHEFTRPSQAELRLAVEIIVHVLDQLYEIPEKALELKKQAAARKKKTSPFT